MKILKVTKKNELSPEKTIKQLEIMAPPELKDLAIQAVNKCKDVRKYLNNIPKYFFK